MDINTNLPAEVTNSVVVVEMKNKPFLAQLMEYPKIKEYPEEIRNSNIFAFIKWALNLLGVSGDEAKIQHHMAAHEYIRLNLGAFTFQELKQAFMMYVSGELEMEVFQQFNSVVAGKVMRRFKKIRNDRISGYLQLRNRAADKKNEKKLSETEKKDLKYMGVVNCFDEWKQSKKIIPGYAWVYDYLGDLDLLTPTTERKKKAMKEAEEKLRLQSRYMPVKKSRKLLSQLEEKNASPAIVTAKNIILAEYFEKIVSKKLHISNLLKNKE